MKTKQLIIYLFILVFSTSAYAQSKDSAAAKEIDPVHKERPDDPNISWRKIAKKDLLAVKHIEELTSNSPDEKYTIQSCKVTFDGEDVPYFEYDIKGDEFSEAVSGNIERSKAGTLIMIEFIKVVEPDGSMRMLPPVNLTLAD
jgi:hypothetical protein